MPKITVYLDLWNASSPVHITVVQYISTWCTYLPESR